MLKRAIKKNKLSLSDTLPLEHARELWKVSLDTQMHFNDLLIKMRTTVISIILAVFGTSAIVIRDIEKPVVNLFHQNIHVSVIVLMVGMAFVLCQYFIDRFYYLKLLLGAVDFTLEIDKKWQDDGETAFGLTTSISKNVGASSAKSIVTFYYSIPVFLSLFVIWQIQAHIDQLQMLPQMPK